MIGQRLAHFEVTAKLGEGGMGEVYRAKDSKLGREVALKVLPEAVAGDEERLARFEREAKVLASLDHSGIARIYSLEEAPSPSQRESPDGGRAVRFLTMELVPGEALDARIARGPLPTDEAIEIARQMAVAIEAAHEQGIVHRDLKPANVMVKPDGEVKILDFGLAKATAPKAASGPSPSLTQSPTITQRMTQAGVLMGTAAYMSPEQARGLEADKRSDIWSFGVVLYEMLTGRNEFVADTVSDTVAAVLRGEPELGRLPASVPPGMRRLLERCLEKDPLQRLRDIGEARILLGGAWEAGVYGEASRPVWTRAPLWLALAVAAALGALLVQWLAGGPAGPPDREVRKFRVGEYTYPGGSSWISPDGKKVLFLDDSGLAVRHLSSLETRRIPGASYTTGWAVWSHDSESIAYADDNKLWKVSLGGGVRRLVTDLPTSSSGPGGGGWLPDGRIVFTTGYTTGLHEVSDQGGAAREILAPDRETEVDYHHASLLPGDRGILFAVHLRGRSDSKIVLYADGEKRVLLEVEGQTLDSPVYSPTGHLLYAQEPSNTGIWAAPFDLERLRVTGEPFLVAPHGSSPSVSADGTMAYAFEGPPPLRELVWVDRSGTVLGRATEPQRGVRNPSPSPNGGVVVAAFENESWDLWEYDLDDGTRRRLTTSLEIEQEGRISVDGRLAYMTSGLEPQIGLLDLETGEDDPSFTAGGYPAWSPDGRYLLWDLFGARGLWMQEFSAAGPVGESRLLLDDPRDESSVRVSPKGTFVAYQADDSGSFRAYVARFPDASPRREITTEEIVWDLFWSSDGEELFLIDGNEDVLAVPIAEENGTPVPGLPQVLFSALGSTGVIAAPDGRFLLVRPVDPDAPKNAVVVVDNWLAEFE